MVKGPGADDLGDLLRDLQREGLLDQLAGKQDTLVRLQLAWIGHLCQIPGVESDISAQEGLEVILEFDPYIGV